MPFHPVRNLCSAQPTSHGNRTLGKKSSIYCLDTWDQKGCKAMKTLTTDLNQGWFAFFYSYLQTSVELSRDESSSGLVVITYVKARPYWSHNKNTNEKRTAVFVKSTHQHNQRKWRRNVTEAKQPQKLLDLKF